MNEAKAPCTHESLVKTEVWYYNRCEWQMQCSDCGEWLGRGTESYPVAPYVPGSMTITMIK